MAVAGQLDGVRLRCGPTGPEVAFQDHTSLVADMTYFSGGRSPAASWSSITAAMSANSECSSSGRQACRASRRRRGPVSRLRRLGEPVTRQRRAVRGFPVSDCLARLGPGRDGETDMGVNTGGPSSSGQARSRCLSPSAKSPNVRGIRRGEVRTGPAIRRECPDRMVFSMPLSVVRPDDLAVIAR
jgi:hypothetical protein